MSTKKIYLIRHGQTDYNLKGIVQGSGVDTSLNDLGRTQAGLFYKYYQTIPFKKVYTSTLKRTTESVQGFIDQGIPWESYTGLNEISWGDMDGKLINAQDNKIYQNLVEEWNKGNLHVKLERGESPLEVQKRIQKVLDIIVSRPDEDIILVCMHGRAIRILLSWIINQDISKMETFAHQNLCLYVLTYSEGKFFIERNCDVRHLSNEGI